MARRKKHDMMMLPLLDDVVIRYGTHSSVEGVVCGGGTGKDLFLKFRRPVCPSDYVQGAIRPFTVSERDRSAYVSYLALTCAEALTLLDVLLDLRRTLNEMQALAESGEEM